MRVCVVYDRLNKIGGAEQVLIALHDLYPTATWYTSVWDPTRAPFSAHWKVHTSWLNKIPWLRTHHEWIPYLMPFVFESFDLRGYDLVISVGSAEAKGVLTLPSTPHLHYCLTPTRYLYSHATEYLSNPLYRFIAHYLRKWDLTASARPDIMIAISTQVKKRIKNIYNRDSEIVFPPVETTKFANPHLKSISSLLPSNYFLVVSRLVPYKKIDILVRAANLAQKNLVIIGEGSEFKSLSRLAGKTVTLLGHVSDQVLPSYYHNCLAYLQANEEDFGIAMCEAQSAGNPVIAYGQGGACDIVIPGKTGLLLSDNSVDSFATAMLEFDTISYVPADCRRNAKRFDRSQWIKNMQGRIKQLCQTTK